jgi:hypothetical protein
MIEGTLFHQQLKKCYYATEKKAPLQLCNCLDHCAVVLLVIVAHCLLARVV